MTRAESFDGADLRQEQLDFGISRLPRTQLESGRRLHSERDGTFGLSYARRMDRSMWKAHLYQAERHVSLGEHHVTRQREMIVELERDGHDATEWRLFLTQLEELLALHVAHRNRLREELGA